MNSKQRLILLGFILLIQGLFFPIDFSRFGIPSIILFGYQIHHWIVGLGLVLYGRFVM